MLTQGSLYVQEWKNGTAEYVDFSDIHITCKYGWKSMDNGTTQVGTLTDVSLAQQSTHDFITIPGDSHTVEASWDDEQHMMESPVLYDVVFTVNNQKINKMSWNPTNNGWTTIGDCDTVDTGINNGYSVEILNHQTDINVETQTDTKAWSTTEPYFGTGVIADGVYYNGNIYLIADGTNHPGELSINETATWNSSDILKYSKQTSGIMFYAWDSGDVTECSSLNHYTWDVSKVYLGYDNTTNLVIGGMTYTKQNPGPAYYEIKCQFNYGGSVRPAKTFIRWGTNEPYTQITYGGVNPEAFSWQESSVPSGEIGTLVVEFIDANDNGLLLDSFSSQNYTYDTDTAGSYGGTRLLIKTPDRSNIYEYAAGNFIECDITLAEAQPSQPDLTGRYYFNSQTNYVFFFRTNFSVDFGQCGDTSNYYYEWSYTDHWTVVLHLDGDTVYLPYDENTDTLDLTGDIFTYSSTDPCGGPQPETYTVTVNVTGQGGVTGAGDYAEWAQVTLTATPSTGYVFGSWQINGTVVETNSTYQFIMGNQDVTITAVFEEEAEKHIYLCDNSGAHLAEMTKTGSTWNATGSFTSGMYSIRATVEGEYEDAWFKFYQTSGDNRVFVGAGDDPDFEEIGTYILIDNILVSFSLVEDQTTGYYVVTYQNTAAMTTSMVDTIVNSYIGDFVTSSDISAMGYMTATDISSMGYMTQTDISSMGYMTQTDISSMGYMTQTDISSMGYMTQTDISSMGYMTTTDISAMSYVDSTTLNSMSYVDQTSLSSMSYVDITSLNSMSYVDNSYLSTYMNNVVGDINAILQTI